MQKNLELRDVSSVTSSKKMSRCRSFHFRYLELCRAKNLTPLPDIRNKNNVNSVLDINGDKLGVNDWLLIIEALYYDQVLQSLSLRIRKVFGNVLDHMDTEKKARLFKQKPVIYTKFIFSGLVEAVANCIEFNKNLKILNLEGLPLNEKYVESIAKALSANESLREISFNRSNVLDKGCEAICNTIKYLENVEKLYLSECGLTAKGAECVADMIKIQKISRYTEGWQKSLRYRDFDPDTIPGLRVLSLARNPGITDDGLVSIVEILKEDCWLKVIDMENCGLTDRGANAILDCLEINNYIIDFNIRNNQGISKFLLRNIREQLGKDDDDPKSLDGQSLLANSSCGSHVPNMNKKLTVNQLKEQLKNVEEQLAFERVLRKKAEQLNEKLNMQILAYENQLEDEANANIPHGYVVVKNDSLQSIIRERNDFQKIASGIKDESPQSRNITKRNKVSAVSQLQKKHYIQLEENAPIQAANQEITIDTPPTSAATIMPKEPRKALKVRKVKSEMKYVEPVPNTSSTKKKESKSDHEFANEADMPCGVQFETNIGDSTAVTMQSMQYTGRTLNSNKSFMPKLDLEDLSLSSPLSDTSDGSTDSDTLRNSVDYQPLKVFIRRNKTTPRSCQPQQLHQFQYQQHYQYIQQQQQQQQHIQSQQQRAQQHQIECGQGEGASVPILKSPRTLFLGLCDD